MRICSPQLGLSPNSILGGEIYDHEVLQGLAKLGVTVDILLPQDHPYDTRVNNWQVAFLPFTRIPAYLFNLLEIPYLFHIYNQHQFQLLRLHAPYFTGIGAWFFRLFYPQVKLVATYHQARRGFPFDLINRLFIRSWDLIITDSLAAKKRLIERFSVSPERFVVIPGGAPSDLEPIRAPRPYRLTGSDLVIEPTDVVLLFMGLFIHRKNPLFILDVVKKVIKHYQNVKLIICGDGPLKTQIRHRIELEKLNDKIILHPPVFGKDKQRLYCLADIFVHPAIHEGLPLVVLEAMACGLPIIVSKGYSALEMVRHGWNGYMAKINDVADWARKVNRLISDQLTREKMGKNSRQQVEQRFTWEKAAQAHYRAFKNLLRQ